jgi:sulfate adenylyltransferase subunit 1
MSEVPLNSGRAYLVQHGVNRVRARLTRVASVLNVAKLEMDELATSVKLNDIARIELRLAGPVYADAYKDNPSNGSFILIDEGSNNTVAGGFIE